MSDGDDQLVELEGTRGLLLIRLCISNRRSSQSVYNSTKLSPTNSSLTLFLLRRSGPCCYRYIWLK